MIAISQQKKEELEAKIAELERDLENHIQHCKITGNDYDYQFEQAIEIYKEILSQAIVLPVEESWQNVKHFYSGDSIKSNKIYPRGVIIQPKQ